MIPIKNSLKQDASLILLYNFAVEFAIHTLQVRQDGYKLNSTHQFLVYAGYISILGLRINTIKKNREA